MMKTRVKIAVNNPIWDSILRTALLRKVDRRLLTDERLSVLELGCGRGGSTKIMLELLPHSFITATDVDDRQIYLAERRIKSKRVEFMVEHAAETSFDDETFDLVTGFNLLHHVPDWHKSLAESARVLKPGGRLVVTGITDRGLKNGWFRDFVAPKAVLTTDDVIQEATRHGLALRENLGNPLYMRLIFQRVPLRPTPKIISL